jgi:hypothetical protein
MARILDRLQEALAPGLPRGIYTWAQRVCEQIENALSSASTVTADLTAVETDVVALEALVSNLAIATSYVRNGLLLEAADVGATATITVEDHARHYGDRTSVNVTGSTVTGLAFSTVYYVYYDQTSRVGGAVTYAAATNPNHANLAKAAGRHYCGKITTPANGAGNTTGGLAPYWGGGDIAAADIPETP